MQCLYAVESETGDLKPEQAAALLDKYLAQTGTLFAFTIYLVTEIARYAETDSKNRASKHLPSQEDLNAAIAVTRVLLGKLAAWRRSPGHRAAPAPIDTPTSTAERRSARTRVWWSGPAR